MRYQKVLLRIFTLVVPLILLFGMPTLTEASELTFHSGYICADRIPISPKNKIVKPGRIKNKIRKLERKIAEQSRAKKKSTKRKIEQLKSLKKSVQACKKGTLVGESDEGGELPEGPVVPPILTNLSGGEFSGSYTSFHSKFGFINGEMNASFSINNGTFTGALLLHDVPTGFGNILQRIEFSGAATGTVDPLSYFTLDPNLGEVRIDIFHDNRLIISNSGSPLIINLEGVFNEGLIIGALSGDIFGVFEGEFNLTR